MFHVYRLNVLDERSQAFADKATSLEAERDDLGLQLEEVTEKHKLCNAELQDTINTLADL